MNSFYGTVRRMSLLNHHDRDRYLLSLFIHNQVERDFIQTLDELNYEISRLKDSIDTPHMGFIRLQWWKDEIKKIYDGGTVSPHPLLEKISAIISPYKIEYQAFDRLIAAREADFEEYDNFDICAYARSIHAPLLDMKAQILNEKNDTSGLAEGFALVGLLRAIPFYKARSQVLLPQVNPDSVRRICDRAKTLLDNDLTLHRYFKAHRALARLYLAQLAKAGYNPEQLYPLPFKELRLWWGTR